MEDYDIVSGHFENGVPVVDDIHHVSRSMLPSEFWHVCDKLGIGNLLRKLG